MDPVIIKPVYNHYSYMKTFHHHQNYNKMAIYSFFYIYFASSFTNISQHLRIATTFKLSMIIPHYFSL